MYTKRDWRSTLVGIGVMVGVTACGKAAVAQEIEIQPDWTTGGPLYKQFHLQTGLTSGFSYYNDFAAAILTQQNFAKLDPAASQYLSQTGQTLSFDVASVSMTPIYQINDRALLFGYVTAGMVQYPAPTPPYSGHGFRPQALPGFAYYDGGIGDVYIGGQYRFLDETDSRPSLTVQVTGIIPAAKYSSLGNGRGGALGELDAKKYITTDTFVTGGIDYGRLLAAGTVAPTNIFGVRGGLGALFDQGQWVPEIDVSYYYSGSTPVGKGLTLGSNGDLDLSFSAETPWKGLKIILGLANLQTFSLSQTNYYFGFSYVLF